LPTTDNSNYSGHLVPLAESVVGDRIDTTTILAHSPATKIFYGKHMTTTAPTLASRLWHNLLKYVFKFGVVGLIGVGVDVIIFNALRLDIFGVELWINGPIGAKVVSTSVAIVFNWLGNRFWTFRGERHTHILREFVEFVGASLAGMGISLGCLWISHYLLGWNSLLADNISGNLVGLALGTIVRFVLYRYWVWNPRRAKPSTEVGL
jgi:putative flippase GtrA